MLQPNLLARLPNTKALDILGRMPCVRYLQNRRNMGAVTGSVISGYIVSIGRPELVFAGAGVLAGALVALGSRESLRKTQSADVK